MPFRKITPGMSTSTVKYPAGKFTVLKETKLLVRVLKSTIGRTPAQKEAIKALGFRRRHQVRCLDDRQEVWGNLERCIEMVDIRRTRPEDIPAVLKTMHGKRAYVTEPGDIELVEPVGLQEIRNFQPLVAPKLRKWRKGGDKVIPQTAVKVESTVEGTVAG